MKQPRNFTCPETGELCTSGKCTVNGKKECEDNRLPRAEPAQTPQAAIRRATAERKAKREKAARDEEWRNSPQGKKFAAEVGRQFVACEIASNDDGVTSPKEIAAELNRRKISNGAQRQVDGAQRLESAGVYGRLASCGAFWPTLGPRPRSTASGEKGAGSRCARGRHDDAGFPASHVSVTPAYALETTLMRLGEGYFAPLQLPTCPRAPSQCRVR